MKTGTLTQPTPGGRWALTLALTLATSVSACAASLRGDLEDHPNGAFAEAALAASPAPMNAPAPAAAASADAHEGTQAVEITSPDGQAAHPNPHPPVRGAVSPSGPNATSPPSISLQPAAPAPGDASGPAAAPGRAASAAPRLGPVTPETLAAIGLTVDGDDWETLQAPDWAAGAALPYTLARRAFFARSPTIAAAAARYRAAFERYGQVSALNDLVRQYDAFGRALKTGATTPYVRGPSLDKRFPFQGVASLQSQVVDADVAQARARFQGEVLRAAAAFDAAFHDLLYQQRAVGVVRRVVGYAAQAAEAARARYRAGSASHASLIQATMRLDDLRLRLQTTKTRRDAAWQRLAAALRLGPGDDTAPGDAVTPPRPTLKLDAKLPPRPPREAARRQAQTRGPRAAEARARSLRATLMAQLAERQLEPPLSPGLSRTDAPPGAGAPTGVRSNLGYMTGGPFVREARQRDAAAQASLDAALRDAPAAADRAWVRLDDALRRRRLYAGVQRARARQAVEVAQRGYRAGRATFFDLDTAVARALEVDLTAHAATRDAFVAAAELAVETGPPGAPAPKDAKEHTP